MVLRVVGSRRWQWQWTEYRAGHPDPLTLRLPLLRYSPTRNANARIEPAVEQIGQQIRDDDRER